MDNFLFSRFDACSTYKSSQINRARTCQISVKFMIDIPIRSPGYMLSRVLLPNLNLHKDHNDNYKLSNLLRSTFPDGIEWLRSLDLHGPSFSTPNNPTVSPKRDFNYLPKRIYIPFSIQWVQVCNFSTYYTDLGIRGILAVSS